MVEAMEGFRTSVSTWSLHRVIGKPGLSLLEAPARCAAAGIHTMELCHFHFPQSDSGYLIKLSRAAREAEVELYSILVDEGDITETDPGCRKKHLEMITSWIEVAALVGAARVRIVAGQSRPSPAAIALSGGTLRELAVFAKAHGVAVSTENFGTLTVDADAVLGVLDAAGPDVGLCADFGNFSGPAKMANLGRIMERATSLHAKAVTGKDGRTDWEEFAKCLSLAKSAGFCGPCSLIHEGPGDPWTPLADLKREVEKVF